MNKPRRPRGKLEVRFQDTRQQWPESQVHRYKLNDETIDRVNEIEVFEIQTLKNLVKLMKLTGNQEACGNTGSDWSELLQEGKDRSKNA